MTAKDPILTVEVLEPQVTFTLRDICERGDCHAEYVIKMVDYGIITPVEVRRETREWEFDLAALARLLKAIRLQRDLDMNLSGLAVSLDLLDEVQAMRREVERLNQQLRQLLDDG